MDRKNLAIFLGGLSALSVMASACGGAKPNPTSTATPTPTPIPAYTVGPTVELNLQLGVYDYKLKGQSCNIENNYCGTGLSDGIYNNGQSYRNSYGTVLTFSGGLIYEYVVIQTTDTLANGAIATYNPAGGTVGGLIGYSSGASSSGSSGSSGGSTGSTGSSGSSGGSTGSSGSSGYSGSSGSSGSSGYSGSSGSSGSSGYSGSSGSSGSGGYSGSSGSSGSSGYSGTSGSSGSGGYAGSSGSSGSGGYYGSSGSSGYAIGGETKDTYLMRAEMQNQAIEGRAEELSSTYSLNMDAARKLTELSDRMNQLSRREGGISAQDQAAIADAALGVAGISGNEVTSAYAKAIQNKDPSELNVLLEKGAANTGTTVTILRDQILPSLGLNLGLIGN